jgi:MFS family permease
MYAFGFFFKPVMNEFNWSRGAVSFAFTTLYLAQGIFQPITGRLTDRYGPRKVILIGAVITGLGFTLLSLTQSLWHYYLLYSIVGIGLAAIGIVPVSLVISNWFSQRRGTALGIATTGVGVGGIVLSPVIGSYLIPTYGWKVSFLGLALISWLILIPITLLVIRDKPGVNSTPDKQGNAGAVELSLPDTGNWSLNMALRTSTFWLIATGFMVSNLSSIGVFQHQVNHFTDIGLATAVAATSMSLVGLGSTFGKISFGLLSDRLRPSYCAAISFIFQAVAIVVLLYTKSTAMVWVYAILMGIGMGGWAPLVPQLVSNNFGTSSFGTILGMMRFAQNLGLIVGPLIAGYAYDSMGTYQWIFVIYLALYAAAIPSVAATRRPRALS